MKKWISLLLCLQAACSASSHPQIAEKIDFSGNYYLAKLDNQALNSLTENQIYFDKSGNARAYLGCNRIFFHVNKTAKNTLRFEQIGSTRMACPPGHIENRFIHLLPQINHYQQRNNQLFLQKNQKDLMQLRRIKP